MEKFQPEFLWLLNISALMTLAAISNAKIPELIKKLNKALNLPKVSFWILIKSWSSNASLSATFWIKKVHFFNFYPPMTLILIQNNWQTFQTSMVLYDVKEIQELRDANAKQEKRIELLESLHNLGKMITYLDCSFTTKKGL